MSKSEAGLMIFASLLMVAITISYFIKPKPEPVSGSIQTKEGDWANVIPQVVHIENDNYESWQRPTLPRNLRNADQQDKDLIEHIRENWILPPARGSRRLSHPEKYDHSEFGQSFVVDKLLKGKDKGFYVDGWAGNGEINSNSLFMEKDRQWQGILIEPNPNDFSSLLGKRRRAYMLNACISPATTPAILNLTYGEEPQQRSVNVQCFPLYSILAAMQVFTVDYMSLRAIGMEMDILRTLPLDSDSLNVRMLSVQTFVDKERRTSQLNHDAVKEILTTHGYQWVDAGDRINRHDVMAMKQSHGNT